MEFKTSVTALPSDEHVTLSAYREYFRAVIDSGDTANPEGALSFAPSIYSESIEAFEAIGPVKHVILIGIGGSSLGTQAIDGALRKSSTPRLTVLDAVSKGGVQSLVDSLSSQNVALSEIAIVIISKSGGTTETITNASLLLSRLTEHYGDVRERVIVVTDEGSKLFLIAQREGYRIATIPHAIGGRFSVFTAVGIIPLALLGYDVENLLRGARDEVLRDLEPEISPAFYSAHLLAGAHVRGVSVYDTFVFETRLSAYAYWRRQLMGESLGKSKTLRGKIGAYGPLPTVSTLIDLHSVGQLYMGGFRGIHTDFVSLRSYGDELIPHTAVSEILPYLVSKSTSHVVSAIYQGVCGTYTDLHLPFNEYVLQEVSEYELGALMAFNMLEIMYAAELMDVDAFDQPNVELYKTRTRDALN